jgi:hypothetical protein
MIGDHPVWHTGDVAEQCRDSDSCAIGWMQPSIVDRTSLLIDPSPILTFTCDYLDVQLSCNSHESIHDGPKLMSSLVLAFYPDHVATPAGCPR